MSGEDRRAKIVALLGDAGEPISGGQLARELGVSRQVIVQDVALLRSSGVELESTHRGYVMHRHDRPRRIFKVYHTEEQIEDELNLIVDLGGTVEDVVVNHRTYGVITVPLNVSSRRDVARYLADIASSRSTPLSRVTSGYHFHHVSAPSEEALDEIGASLAKRGYLVDRLPYETVE